jgi:hypothetical protein
MLAIDLGEFRAHQPHAMNARTSRRDFFIQRDVWQDILQAARRHGGAARQHGAVGQVAPQRQQRHEARPGENLRRIAIRVPAELARMGVVDVAGSHLLHGPILRAAGQDPVKGYSLTWPRVMAA